MTIKKLFPYLLLAVIFLFFAVFVSAKNEGIVQQNDQKREAKATDSAVKTEQKQTTNAEKCAKITSKIDEKINKFNSNSDHPRLTKLQQKLTEVISRLKAKGYDTSKLEEDLVTLKTKTDTCKTAYGQFIAKLGATKNFACGQSQGQFKAALQAGKDEMRKAQAACKDAKNFLETILKKDLQTLRNQVKENRKLTPKPNKTQIKTSSEESSL